MFLKNTSQILPFECWKISSDSPSSFRIKVSVVSMAPRPCLIDSTACRTLIMASALPAPLLFTKDFMCTPIWGPSSPLFPLLWKSLLPHPDGYLDFCTSLHLMRCLSWPTYPLSTFFSLSSFFVSPEHLQSSHIPAMSSFIILLSVFPTGLWVPYQQRHLSSLFKEASTVPDCTKSSINLLPYKWIWMNECLLYK